MPRPGAAQTKRPGTRPGRVFAGRVYFTLNLREPAGLSSTKNSTM
jgi:CRISPR/Cas system endoribonuclease Cas6 (RAMP superfamily)